MAGPGRDAGEDQAAPAMQRAGEGTSFSLRCIKDKRVPIGVTVVVAALLLAIIALAGEWLRMRMEESIASACPRGQRSPPPAPLVPSEEVPLLPLLPRSRPFQLPGKRDRIQAEVLLLRGGRSGVEQERELLPVPRSPFGRHQHVGGAAFPPALRGLPALLDRAAEGRSRSVDVGQWVPLQQLVPSPREGTMRLCQWRRDQQRLVLPDEVLRVQPPPGWEPQRSRRLESHLKTCSCFGALGPSVEKRKGIAWEKIPAWPRSPAICFGNCLALSRVLVFLVSFPLF